MKTFSTPPGCAARAVPCSGLSGRRIVTTATCCIMQQFFSPLSSFAEEGDGRALPRSGGGFSGFRSSRSAFREPSEPDGGASAGFCRSGPRWLAGPKPDIQGSPFPGLVAMKPVPAPRKAEHDDLREPATTHPLKRARPTHPGHVLSFSQGRDLNPLRCKRRLHHTDHVSRGTDGNGRRSTTELHAACATRRGSNPRHPRPMR